MANTKPRPRTADMESEQRLHVINHQAPGHSCEYCDESEPNIRLVQMRLRAYEASAKKKRLEVQDGPDTSSIKFNVQSEELDHNTKSKVKIALCAVGVILLGLLGSTLFPSETANSAFIASVNGKKFCTADGSLDIAVYGGQAVVDGISLSPSQIDVKTWTGSWGDELDLLKGSFRNYKWVQATPEGIQLDGVPLYAEGSPEFVVVSQMRDLKNAVASYYAKNGHYPSLFQGLQADIHVNNPVTGRTEYPEINSLVGATLVSATGSTPFETELRAGQPIGGKNTPKACEIRCLEVKSEPLLAADLNSYGWKTVAFFIQGYDRHAQPIKNLDSSKVLLMTLKNGQDTTDISDRKTARAIAGKKQALCLYSGDAPSETNIRFKYLAVLAVIVGIILFICNKRLSADSEEFSTNPTQSV